MATGQQVTVDTYEPLTFPFAADEELRNRQQREEAGGTAADYELRQAANDCQRLTDSQISSMLMWAKMLGREGTTLYFTDANPLSAYTPNKKRAVQS